MSHIHFPRTSFAGIVFLLALTAAGCGGKGGTSVSGTVTYNGQPVEKGYITFFPSDGKSSPAGGEVTGGKFTVHNVSLGKNRVEVASTSQTKGSDSMDDAIKAAKQGPPADVIQSNAEGNGKVHEISSDTPPLELKLVTQSTSGPPIKR